MIPDFLRAVVSGFLAPRRSVRAIIDRGREMGHGLGVAVLLVLLAHLIAAILQNLTPGAETLESGGVVDRHVFALIQQFAWFFILSGLAFIIGRAAGGTGTRVEMQLAIGWHAVVTSFLTPVFVRFAAAFDSIDVKGGMAELPPELEGGTVLPFTFAAAVIVFWLLAQYIAEVHRFRSALGVLGVVVGAMVAAAFLIFGALGAG